MAIVLLVDDSPSIRSILKIYLLPLNLEFVDAEDGVRALQLLRLMKIDLVVADVKMAPIDGITFVEKVRRSDREELRRLPVVLLTGETAEGLRERGLAAGADAFIHKPIDPKSLLSCLKQLLERRAPETSSSPR